MSVAGLRRRLRLAVQPVRSQLGRLVSRAVNAGGAPPIGLRVGQRTAAEQAAARRDLRPVVPVLLFGAEPEAVAQTAAALVRAAADPACGRPLLVLDRPHFALVRLAGCAVEHVTSRQEWLRHGEPVPWEQHLAARLAQLRTDYVTARTVVLPPAGSAALPPGALPAALRVPPVTGPARLRRELAGAVERLLDR
jgi:hypothetical protein